MGFFGDMLKSAGKSMMEAGAEMQRKKLEYASYSDSRLASICKSDGMFGSSTMEKGIAWGILKERHGDYGAKEIVQRA